MALVKLEFSGIHRQIGYTVRNLRQHGIPFMRYSRNRKGASLSIGSSRLIVESWLAETYDGNSSLWCIFRERDIELVYLISGVKVSVLGYEARLWK